MMVDIRKIRIAPDGSHHTYLDKPLYSNRFKWVLKFHLPNLAPAADETGAFHITLEGKPAHTHRFIRTFGFYDNRAAVIYDKGWGHVDPTGELVYSSTFIWVGNFQEECCPVRTHDRDYYHIFRDGDEVYSERYLYAGDFRDGIAVIRLPNNLTTHIDKNGNQIHFKCFLNLDVYHKGFARAEDEKGWHHVDLEGIPVYEARFINVEPFYNGFAQAWDFKGRIGIINESGEWIHTICEKYQTKLEQEGEGNI